MDQDTWLTTPGKGELTRTFPFSVQLGTSGQGTNVKLRSYDYMEAIVSDEQITKEPFQCTLHGLLCAT
jgi:hypothetical protein